MKGRSLQGFVDCPPPQDLAANYAEAAAQFMAVENGMRKTGHSAIALARLSWRLRTS